MEKGIPTPIDFEKTVDGIKLKIHVPLSYQGLNSLFKCDNNELSTVKIDYLLCDYFEVFRNDIDKDEFRGLGYSNLHYTEKDILEIVVPMSFQENQIKVIINCEKNAAGRIRNFRVCFSVKMKIDEAVYLGHKVMTEFLDRITFYLGIPIDYKGINVYTDLSSQVTRLYQTIPYSEPVNLRLDEILSHNFSPLLSPILTKFREGMNSVSPLYTCLCYYSAYEGLLKIKGEVSKDFQKIGETPKRPKLFLDDNEYTREICPSFIGKNIKEFFEKYVKEKFRNKVAHLFDRDISHIKPMSLEVITTLRIANRIMSQYLPKLIKIEMDLLSRLKR